METKRCTRCAEVKSVDEFYFVSKERKTRRGMCKPCGAEVKALQRDPDWMPSCTSCRKPLAQRAGPGRRLCQECAEAKYDMEDVRPRGSRRLKLKPCSLCGGKKERFERGKMCSYCKPWAGYASSLRRFGMTPKDYEAILEVQGGACYICRKIPTRQKLAIDHDHALGENRYAVRGLLCSPCNYQRLPLFKEKAAMLERAALYLRRPPARLLWAEESTKSE